MKKFHSGWENYEEQGCVIKQWKHKMHEGLFKKFQEDESAQEELQRGTVRELSILFADIRGFTSRTETMSPDKIVTLIDLFIPEMLHIIINRHKGMVDKLLGDGIMALYGYPYQTQEETIQSVYSAIDMQQAASAMGTVLENMGYEPIEIGVGINTGSVLICEVGDHNYRESTVIGAPVNLAAKMEDVAGAGEIVLPAASVDMVSSLKPQMREYFTSQGEKHGVEVHSLEWAEYLRNNQREVQGWEITHLDSAR